jgi:hypothetical protein
MMQDLRLYPINLTHEDPYLNNQFFTTILIVVNIKPFKELFPFKNRSSSKVLVNAIVTTNVNSGQKPIR